MVFANLPERLKYCKTEGGEEYTGPVHFAYYLAGACSPDNVFDGDKGLEIGDNGPD